MALQWGVEELASLLTTPLTPSHYLELLNPFWSRQLRARITEVWDETPDVRTITLQPSRPFRSQLAGQHVQVSVPIDGVALTRMYSISSSPDRADGQFTLTIKAQGRVSRQLVRHARIGDILAISPPKGDFVLSPGDTERALFITAGSGVTPIMSMIRGLAGTMPEITHLHYAPSAHHSIFRNERVQLAARESNYRLHELCPSGDAGRFDRDQLSELCPDWRNREAWVCGPLSLIESVHRTYAEVGLDRAVRSEHFAPAPRGECASREGRVRFSLSRREAVSDGATSLLELAEETGLLPNHGCRMGICHSCDTRLVAGAVRDLRSGELIDEPGRTIQPCICAAAGDAAVEL